MLFIVTVMLVAFLFALVQATYVIVKNTRAAPNRLFAILSFIFSIWFLGTAFQLSSGSETAARIWFKIGTLGWFFISPVFVHFILALTEDDFSRKHRWFAPLLYLPAAAMTCVNLLVDVGAYHFVETDIGWTYTQDLTSVWITMANALSLVSTVSGLAILSRWSRKSSDPQRRTQSRIIMLSSAAAVLLYGAVASLSLIPGLGYLPSIGNIFTIILLAGIAIAIVRYKLMSISPTDAAFTIFTTMADGVLLINRDGIVASANPAACGILQASADSLVGSHVKDTLPGVFVEEGAGGFTGAADSFRDLETIHVAGGKTAYLSVSVSKVMDRSGGRYGTVIVFRDVTEHKNAENQLHHMATHDVLTGLPNRTLLNDRLKNALSRAMRYTQILAVLFIDLDKFKDINDRYGHDSGDLMLREAARRLTKCVREYDTVCRLGGDEFVVVLTDLKDMHDCERVIERIRASFHSPIGLKNVELTMTLSIGVSLYPLHSDTTEDLFKFADIALYRVKSTGRNGYRFYAPEVDAVPRRTEVLEKDLADALSRNEFEIFYQPIYDLGTNRPVAMESLLRWNHPDFGVVQPMDFIPIAERTGHIVAIGEWALRDACRQLKEWSEKGLEIPLAVNISARQFHEPDIVEKIAGILEEFRVDPRLIELEFTESTAMVDVDRTVEIAWKLKDRGIRIVIDNFGSGFSSMTWLKQLNPEALKIDKFFIQNVGSDVNDAAIVKAIVTMAHSMGIRAIAEGIESKEQLDAIRSMRWERSTGLACDCVQGFLFSEPVPASKAVRFLGRGPDQPS